MESLVIKNQSPFIKGRNLHDNFLLVWQLVGKINTRKEPGILVKLDLARAFDSLSRAFLFEVLYQLGFLARVLGWIAVALRTATTRISLNGVPEDQIRHARWLH
jgi:hypothetical protein